MPDQPNPPTPSGDRIDYPTETAENRAAVIAGFRAFAQFLEDRPDVPCPQYIRQQHSYLEPLNLSTYQRMPVPDAEKIAFVRDVARKLGVDAQISDTSVYLEYQIAPRTTYTVHAALRGDL